MTRTIGALAFALALACGCAAQPEAPVTSSRTPRLVVLLAVDGEDLGDRHAGCGLDFLIGITEGQLERLREPAAHGALSGAHEPDEHKRSRAELAADGMAALACLVLPADFIERIEAADIVHVLSRRASDLKVECTFGSYPGACFSGRQPVTRVLSSRFPQT